MQPTNGSEVGAEPSFLLVGSRLDQFESWGSTTNLALGLEERGYLVGERRQAR